MPNNRNKFVVLKEIALWAVSFCFINDFYVAVLSAFLIPKSAKMRLRHRQNVIFYPKIRKFFHLINL
ncbi:hypothetical protein AKG33_06980 [Dichelobacter nodosus]|nr:hypothetical protein DYQ38_03495 [Dichelobacter nodosus]KNZ38947.1 hypothetical protein AKG33_06980 [Dichelobacter nodosus]